MRILKLMVSIILFTGCTNSGNESSKIDDLSYNLGSIGAFGEMVNSGVKQLALSSPMTTSEMDVFIIEATKVAAKNNVI